MNRRDHTIGSKPSRRAQAKGARRRVGRAGVHDGGMYLRSIRATVPVDPDLLSPQLRVAMVEDLWWCIESEAWSARRPHWWHQHEHARWRAYGRALDEKRKRICALVEQ
jgi:hypothetical protein